MPILPTSSYKAPPFLSNGHIQTLFPPLFRRVATPTRRRERIDTPDGDFLDLDWTENGPRRLVVLTHGLEGHSSRKYILGMTLALRNHGWDSLAWNCRGCSGELNRTLRFYHSGATEDLNVVVQHALQREHYSEIALIGYSLGGNMTLKYLGEQSSNLHPAISKAIAFSVPCDLAAGSHQMAHFTNRIYMASFLRSLRKKIRLKALTMPGQINDDGFSSIKTFKQFDDRYTAPLHGFDSAEDYWTRSSCKTFIRSITIPTLLVNARNDPFLAGDCYPTAQAAANPNFFLEMPESGGHSGFITFNPDGLNPDGRYWPETRALEFLTASP